jgi:dTMP kinase
LLEKKGSKKEENGKILIIEGIDKSGKTTQSKLLYNFYQEIYLGQVGLLNFPDYNTRIGREIELFLQGNINYPAEVKHLLLSANRWEKKDEIERLRARNKILIINRYYQTNLVYGLANDLNFDFLFNLDLGLPREDIVIVLDIDPNVSYKRSVDNNFILDEFEKNLKFLQIVRQKYLFLAKKFNWHIINADMDKITIMKTIVNIINLDNQKNFKNY